MSARPGVGPLAGWRGAEGDKHRAAARRTRDQLERYVANGCFWKHELARGPALLQTRQQGLSRNRGDDGLHR